MCECGESKARYLDAKGLAEYLGLTVASVYVRVSRRTLPHIRMGGRTMFDRQEIDRWMKAQTVDPVDISV